MELMHDELAEIEKEINEQLKKVRAIIAQANADKVAKVSNRLMSSTDSLTTEVQIQRPAP